jgi:hypothetical protein
MMCTARTGTGNPSQYGRIVMRRLTEDEAWKEAEMDKLLGHGAFAECNFRFVDEMRPPWYGYDNIGLMNAWGIVYPKEWKHCIKNHRHTMVVVGNCHTIHYCDECRIYWEIDSSD